VEVVASFLHLEVLDLLRTRVTDEGVLRLQGLSRCAPAVGGRVRHLGCLLPCHRTHDCSHGPQLRVGAPTSAASASSSIRSLPQLKVSARNLSTHT